jgi:hypothetical protein
LEKRETDGGTERGKTEDVAWCARVRGGRGVRGGRVCVGGGAGRGRQTRTCTAAALEAAKNLELVRSEQQAKNSCKQRILASKEFLLTRSGGQMAAALAAAKKEEDAARRAAAELEEMKSALPVCLHRATR